MKKIIYIILITAVSASVNLNQLSNRPIGDVNQDGIINVSDVIILVDLILD